MKTDKQPLVQKVADRIIKIILDENLQPGDRLPNEFELAARQDIGRNTVREAIKILVSQNVLEIRRGSGTFVAQRMGIADDPLGLKFVTNKPKLAADIMEIRYIFEPELAAQASRNATDADIRKILRLCGEVEDLLRGGDGESHMVKDIEFHEAIAIATGNLVAPNLVPIINSAIAVYIGITRGRMQEETIRTHRQIANAIAQRKPAAAARAMRLHLQNNIDLYRSMQ